MKPFFDYDFAVSRAWWDVAVGLDISLCLTELKAISIRANLGWVWVFIGFGMRPDTPDWR